MVSVESTLQASRNRSSSAFCLFRAMAWRFPIQVREEGNPWGGRRHTATRTAAFGEFVMNTVWRVLFSTVPCLDISQRRRRFVRCGAVDYPFARPEARIGQLARKSRVLSQSVVSARVAHHLSTGV